MSKKNAILLVLIIASLLIGSLLGFYFYTLRNNPGSSFLGTDLNSRNFADFTDSGTPNSSSTSTPISPTVVTPSSDSPDTVVSVPKLRKIYVDPITGADFVDIDIYSEPSTNIEPEDTSRTGAVTARVQAPRVIRTEERIRFLDRSTGHIYETSSSTTDVKRITNTTIPRLQEAYFVERGQSLILRGLIGSTDVIETRYATIQMATTSEDLMTVNTKSLAVNLIQSVTSPLRNLTFNVQKSGVTGFISTPDGGGIQNVLTTPFTEWLVQWPERRNVALTTKASGLFPGYSYLLNTDNRSFTRAIGELNGLTTNYSPDVANVLFGVTTGGRYNLLTYNMQRGSTTDLGINTFPEKCVWSTKEKGIVFCAIPESMPIGLYPDSWYQGRVLFSDNLWKINTVTMEYRVLSLIQETSGEFIDVENIKLSKNEDYLVFRNKMDLSLWGYNLLEDVVTTSTATSTTQ